MTVFRLKHLAFIAMLLLLIGCPDAGTNPPTSSETQIEYFRTRDGRTSVEKGESVTLEWKALNTTTCLLQFTPNGGEPSDLEDVACESEQIYKPEKTTNYRFSALKKDGQSYERKDLKLTVQNGAADTIPPQVIAPSPANGVTGVSLNTSITVSFSEAMNKPATQNALTITPAIDCAFSWNTDATELSCNPSADLTTNSTYTITLNTGAQDIAGNSLTSAFSSSFTTVKLEDTLVQFGGPDFDAAWSVSKDNEDIYLVGETDGVFDENNNLFGINIYVRKLDRTGTVAWIREFGTSENDRVRGVSADKEGIYVAGNTRGSLGGANAGESDVFIRKYNRSGDIEWTRQFGTAGADIARSVAANGEAVYLVGMTQGNSDDAFIRKYSNSGELEWTRQFGTNQDDSAESVGVSGDDIYIAGSSFGALSGTAGNKGGRDAFLARYNSSGDLIWTRQFGTDQDDFASSLSVNGDDIYVVGHTSGSLPTSTNRGGRDAFALKYTEAGELGWTQQFGTTENDAANSVSANDKAIYVVGQSNGDLVKSQVGNGDIFIRKLSKNGGVGWGEQFGTGAFEAARAVHVDGGIVYVVGETYGSLQGESAGVSDSFLYIHYDGNE